MASRTAPTGPAQPLLAELPANGFNEFRSGRHRGALQVHGRLRAHADRPDVQAFGQTYIELRPRRAVRFLASGIAREFVVDGHNALVAGFRVAGSTAGRSYATSASWAIARQGSTTSALPSRHDRQTREALSMSEQKPRLSSRPASLTMGSATIARFLTGIGKTKAAAILMGRPGSAPSAQALQLLGRPPARAASRPISFDASARRRRAVTSRKSAAARDGLHAPAHPELIVIAGCLLFIGPIAASRLRRLARQVPRADLITIRCTPVNPI